MIKYSDTVTIGGVADSCAESVFPERESTPRAAIVSGIQAVSPILLGVLPFGMVTGAATVALGMSGFSALGMSLVVFAGMAQLAMVDLLGKDAPLAVIVTTALVVNLRFAMYSAALAVDFRGLPLRWTAPLSYLLTDQAFAVSLTRFHALPVALRKWFYLGAAMTLWCSWQASFAFGAFIGMRLSPDLSLDFAVPLTLLALLPASIKSAAARVTLGATAVAICFLTALPLELGTVAAVAIGVFVGSLFLSRRKS